MRQAWPFQRSGAPCSAPSASNVSCAGDSRPDP